jgi:hypothetical protein
MLKNLLLVLTVALSMGSTVNAAVFLTLSGQPTLNTARQSDGTTLTPVGTRYYMLVDTGSTGFAGATTNSIAADSSTSLASTLAGDTIVYRGLTSSTGRINNQQAAGNTLSSVDLESYTGKQFAFMWFDSDPGATLADGTKYGFVTNSTWLVPATSGTWSFTTSVPGANQFSQASAPGSATLVVGAIPEPSRMIFLGFGAIGLIVRRRR